MQTMTSGWLGTLIEVRGLEVGGGGNSRLHKRHHAHEDRVQGHAWETDEQEKPNKDCLYGLSESLLCLGLVPGLG